MLTSTQACAHGDEAPVLPEGPGLRLGAAAAIAHVDASQVLPSNRMAGYLLQGDPGIDRRGTGLEHAVIDAGWRLDDIWGASLAIGQHDKDAAHVEDAWVQARWRTERDEWLVTAGRTRPEMGVVLASAGHLDRFAMVPLAKRVVINDDWIDDGLQWGWRSNGVDLQWSVDAGLWSGQVFPGARSGDLVPALHGGVTFGDLRVDGFVARFEAQGRGAVTYSTTGAHSHSAPVCDALLKQVVCFDGTSEIAGASVRWNSHDWPLTLSLAGMLRRDSGSLQSANGIANYTGNNQGVWADAVWRVHPNVEVGARFENLFANHDLNGPGASLLASESGFGMYKAANRTAFMLAYIHSDKLEMRLESGREDVAGVAATYAAVRLIGRMDYFFANGK